MTLTERFRAVAARKRLARRTQDCYWDWIVKFLQFHRDREQWKPAQSLNHRAGGMVSGAMATPLGIVDSSRAGSGVAMRFGGHGHA